MNKMSVAEFKQAVKTLTYLSRIEQGRPAAVYLEAALANAKADLASAEQWEAVHGRSAKGE